ncbi:MAG TPA: STAS domain-containing protein [Marmoricola sp.]|nr:STAS domain-containing protein [Marmoricola sp.]
MPEQQRAWIRCSTGGPEGAAPSDSVVVHLGGELDLASVPGIEPDLDAMLTDTADNPGDGPVVVDVAELEFLDSSGVAVLIRLANHLGAIRLVNANPVVRRVVEVLSLAPRLGLEAE